VYLTERAVFELRDGALTLIEVAPGIDPQRQVLSLCAPGVRVADPLATMDARIFDPAPMLSRDAAARPSR
jgi:propionate CoA-transferase